jgi:hypothetical protein
MKTRVFLPLAYAVLVGAALLWMFVQARETPFAGMFPLLLTLPWSLVAVLLLTAIAPGLFDSSLLPGTLVFLAGACINAVLLYLLVSRIGAQHEK